MILVYTVIVMIQKIEDALNFTWHVERPRSLARRVIEYIVVMLVGPVLIVASMVLMTRIEASDMMSRVSGLAATPGLRGHYAPYVMIIGLFWFLYSYMPNTRVRWRRRSSAPCSVALRGSALGAIFTRIAVYATQTAAIYAGFAIVLLFMVWLHVSWLIMLLGGQLSFYVQHPEHLRTGHGPIPTTSVLRERIALGAMYLLGERFVRADSAGRSPISRTTWMYRHRWSMGAVAARRPRPGAHRRRRYGRPGPRPRQHHARRNSRCHPARDAESAPSRPEVAAPRPKMPPAWLTRQCARAWRRRRCATC